MDPDVSSSEGERGNVGWDPETVYLPQRFTGQGVFQTKTVSPRNMPASVACTIREQWLAGKSPQGSVTSLSARWQIQSKVAEPWSTLFSVPKTESLPVSPALSVLVTWKDVIRAEPRPTFVTAVTPLPITAAHPRLVGKWHLGFQGF